MKIAVLGHIHFPIAEPFAGGLEMHTHMMVNELVARGHDVTLYAKSGSVTDAKLFKVLGKRFRFKKYKSKLSKELQEQRMHVSEFIALSHMKLSNYDVIINNSLSPLPYKMLQSTPMLTILHTPATLERINRIIEHDWTASPVHRFVTISQVNKLDWDKLLPNIQVIPNGVKLTDWHNTIKPIKNTAVWSGRVTNEKGLHIAIDAANIAGMNLKIAGPLYDKQYFNEQIKPRLSNTVEYVGHINHQELVSFYASGEVALCTPIWEEPFGLTTVEAIASGTPVAALPHGAMPEIITRKVGRVSCDDTPEQLAKMMLEAKTLSRSDCMQYAQKYCAKIMVAGYEQVIDTISNEPLVAPICDTV